MMDSVENYTEIVIPIIERNGKYYLVDRDGILHPIFNIEVFIENVDRVVFGLVNQPLFENS